MKPLSLYSTHEAQVTSFERKNRGRRSCDPVPLSNRGFIVLHIYFTPQEEVPLFMV